MAQPVLMERIRGGKPNNLPDLGAISRYDGNQSIWERGGEKRTSYK